MDAALLHRIASSVSAPATTASVIYLAIGCAQGHYPPGEHSAQQYPPFLATWNPPTAERHVILVDPALEDPPRCVADIATAQYHTENIHIYPIRAPFDWETPDSRSRAFLAGLIRIALAAPLSKPTYLIVQDYSGADLPNEYTLLLQSPPHRTHPAALLDRVLFDPSYDGPGCFPDLTTPILRDPATGHFLQPAYVPLRTLANASPPPTRKIIEAQQEVRSSRIRYYAARFLRGELSPTSEYGADALQRLQAFAPIVGYMPTTDPTILRHLIAETLRDFGAVATPPRTYTDAQINAILADPRGNALNLEFHALTR
jgi:hypothetical protein